LETERKERNGKKRKERKQKASHTIKTSRCNIIQFFQTSVLKTLV
jgi:hypothetical protein